jgi:murein DD-endopeptidase MepM/ murein hydrolase activator NlpD
VRSVALEKLESGYVLGVVDYHFKGLYGQLWWAANQLSIGYYGWREGWLLEIPLPNGQFFLPAPDENAGSVALQAYFASLWNAHDQADKMGSQAWASLQPDPFDESDWQSALTSESGFMALYQDMYGDFRRLPWANEPIYPPGLSQPALILPFEPGWLWSFASGPHPAWEKAGALAALDFAPASYVSGCQPTQAWVTAVADGPVVRIGPGLVLQDLDAPGLSDGQEQTGWAILYMHIADQDKVPLGAQLRAGDLIGHPSCEGGPSTGTHLHIARKYNGEWIAAGGALPFVLDGWTAHAGDQPYQGTLTRDGKVVVAHPYGSFDTQISRDEGSPVATPPAALKPDP